MRYSEQLKIIQQVGNLTQEELAQKLEVSYPTVNSWINERSEPRKKTAERINALYKKYTGQKTVSDSALAAKKGILKKQVSKHPSVLRKILSTPDIYNEFLLALTYNSNSIEGSTLTKLETAAVIFDNASIPNKGLVELMEAKNHRAALDFLFDYLRDKGKINEKLILDIHEKIMNGIRQDAGRYRKDSVRIAGADVATSNPAKVPEKMRKLFSDIKNWRGDNLIAHLADIHARFEQIHPFTDGNGRVGRLLMSAQALKNNYPPVIIENSIKHIYYRVLNTAQKKDETEPLENFIADTLIKSFKILR